MNTIALRVRPRCRHCGSTNIFPEYDEIFGEELKCISCGRVCEIKGDGEAGHLIFNLLPRKGERWLHIAYSKTRNRSSWKGSEML